MSDTETNETDQQSVPLAWDKEGHPIELPAEAIGWRVRRFKLGAAGGPPELLYVEGRPLVLSLDADVADLLEQAGGKPGRYRLEAIDDNGRPLAKVAHGFAVVERPVSSGQPDSNPTASAAMDAMNRMVACVETLLGKVIESQAHMAAQQAAMMNAAGNMLAPVDKRRVPIEIVAPSSENGGAAQGFDWNSFWTTCGPMVQGALGMLMQKMSATPSAPAGGTP